MALDLDIPGYTIKTVDDGQCSGVRISDDPRRPEVGKCSTNAIFAIYKGESKDADYRCWKHFREFIAQNPNAVADIVIQPCCSSDQRDSYSLPGAFLSSVLRFGVHFLRSGGCAVSPFASTSASGIELACDEGLGERSAGTLEDASIEGDDETSVSGCGDSFFVTGLFAPLHFLRSLTGAGVAEVTVSGKAECGTSAVCCAFGLTGSELASVSG
jgi:hypothetical protein